MKGLVALYIQQFKTTTAMMFQYRASLIIWMLGQVLEPLVYLIVWSTVSNTSNGSVGDYTTSDFAAYFIILMVVNQVTYTWIMYEFEFRIRQGTFSFALLKPVHPIHSDIADNLSSKLITLPLILLVAVGLALGFRAGFSFTLWNLVLFFPALLLAFGVRFLLEWTLAQVAFWTTRVSAVNQIYFFLLLFLSGQIAPLTLLPAPIQAAAAVLPFRSMIGFPTELLMGRLTVAESLSGLGIQLAWIVAGVLLVRVVWKAAVKVYSAVGS